MVRDFVIDVKRVKKSEDDTDIWTARWNDQVFSADSEAGLREAVRLLLLDVVSRESGASVDALTAKLTRTWRVRITESAEAEDAPLWDLFA